MCPYSAIVQNESQVILFASFLPVRRDDGLSRWIGCRAWVMAVVGCFVGGGEFRKNKETGVF